MIFLVIIFFLIVSIIFFLFDPNDWRENILKSFLVTFFLIGFSTEILSIFDSINFQWVQTTWIISCSISFLVLIYFWARIGKPEKDPTAIKEGNSGTISKKFLLLCLSILGLITSVTLFIALKSPPNNFDSMTYHMARIPHWIQNQNIRYYPTAIPRQNYSMPLAEFGILHFQILSRSDLYANLVQWFSFVISILTAALIAKQYKVSVRGQWITAVLTATLPMAILQSTSTQNDLITGVFCLGFLYFLNQTIKTNKWENVLFAGISMGLALATKGTAYIYCAAIGLGLGSASLIGKKLARIKGLVVRYLVLIAIALALNSGIYLRNWNSYQNPLITGNERTMVEEITPGTLLANILRNGTMHLGTPLQQANDLLTRSVRGLLGEQIDNPASTFQGSRFEIVFKINEDDTGNALHLVLITLSILIVPFFNNQQKGKQKEYLLVIILSILLFSLAFKWQPWSGRLQTPIFIFGSILIGFVFDILFKKDLIPSLVIVLLVVVSTPYLFLNSNRPLLPAWENDSVFHDTPLERRILTGINQKLEKFPGLSDNLDSFFSLFYEGRSVLLTERKELYFLGNFEPYYGYKAASHFVRNDPSRNIGLLMDSNDWEYPLWVLINQHASPGSRYLYHIQLEDISADLSQDLNPIPELILVTRADYQNISFLADYEQVYTSPSIQIMKLIK